MTQKVHCVTQEMSLADAVTFLLVHGIGSAPVVESTDTDPPTLVGFLSERDCLEVLSNESFFGGTARPETVGMIMRRHPVCVEPETDLYTLASVFVHHGYRHLPVCWGRELLGIISRSDILRAMDRYVRQELNSTSDQKFPPRLGELNERWFQLTGVRR
jgi:CBS domain-containing protein